MANITVSAEQRLELAMSLLRNADWSRLTPESVQVVIDAAPKSAGREFTYFVENGGWVQVGDFFRETGELAIQIPALPRLKLAELREKFLWIREEEGIERDVSPTEAVTLRLGTVLRADEESLDGKEYKRRRASLTGLHGYQQAAWFVEHQDEFPELMTLLGKIYIDFPGLVVVSADGDRSFPCLRQSGERWKLDWGWVGGGFNSFGRIASSGK
ncbi:MAG: hypothetical protein G01um101430_397 [Parcubacteria group bacterium Gr01-1014_30]|nr:MAG: hypothetical protein G01um101430_397 [Parcubacteria group bacterium Gr01-1014_30]